METNFTPHCPQTDYTATIKLTVTKEEISALCDMLEQAEPSDIVGKDIKSDVLYELRAALAWIEDMEDIRNHLQEIKSRNN